MKIGQFFKVLFITVFYSQMTYAANCTPAEYLRARPDVVAAGMSAQVHYTRHGKNEGMCNPTGNNGQDRSRSLEPESDRSNSAGASNSPVGAKDCHPEDYLKIRPDVVAGGMTAEVHYQRHGKAEGMCRPNSAAAKSISNPNICTPADYASTRPKLAASGMTPIQHYLRHGYKEGMCRPSDKAVPRSSSSSSSSSSGSSSSSSSSSGSTTDYGNSGETSTEVAKDIPRGPWGYIDDMVQTLNIQYPNDTRKECQFSGDTNAPQDWVATLMLGASYNTFPKFMGASTTGCGRSAASQSGAGKRLGEELSMGVPVFAGNNKLGDHGPSNLSRKIVEETTKGEFTLVVGGPFTDVWAALKSNPEIKDNLIVYGIEPSNAAADQVAFDNLKRVLGTNLNAITNRDYRKLISDKFSEDKMKWLNKLRYVPEWNKVNTKDIIAHNTWHNRGYGPDSKGLRIADIILVKWYFTKSYSTAVDVNKVLPAIEDGAKKLKPKGSGGGNGETIGAPDDFNIDDVTWATGGGNMDIASWETTVNLSKVDFSDDKICMTYSGHNWPRYTSDKPDAGGNLVTVDANPWIIVKKDGKWHAATWEWLRPGQSCKLGGHPSVYAALATHISHGKLRGFSPSSGETIGIMISSMARYGPNTNGSSAKERSNIIFVTVP